MGAVAVEDHRGQRRHEQHLVSVADDAIRFGQAGDQVTMLRAEGGRTAVGSVDVQPDFVSAADVGNVDQRIERADRRGTRGRRDRDDRHTLRT